MPKSFSLPHSVALDQQELIVYVADRENGRVLAFETETGKYKNHYAGFGDKVFAITYSPLRGTFKQDDIELHLHASNFINNAYVVLYHLQQVDYCTLLMVNPFKTHIFLDLHLN